MICITARKMMISHSTDVDLYLHYSTTDLYHSTFFMICMITARNFLLKEGSFMRRPSP